jgi:hypothetical protein
MSDLDRAVDRSLERIEKELEPVERDYRLRLAGTMIGASNGSDSEIPLDWSLFCVIMNFLLGLAGTGLALFAERSWYWSIRHRVVLATLESHLQIDGVDPCRADDLVPRRVRRITLLESLYTVGMTLAWVGLSTGVFLGIHVLGKFTDSPWW